MAGESSTMMMSFVTQYLCVRLQRHPNAILTSVVLLEGEMVRLSFSGRHPAARLPPIN